MIFHHCGKTNEIEFYGLKGKSFRKSDFIPKKNPKIDSTGSVSPTINCKQKTNSSWTTKKDAKISLSWESVFSKVADFNFQSKFWSFQSFGFSFCWRNALSHKGKNIFPVPLTGSGRLESGVNAWCCVSIQKRKNSQPLLRTKESQNPQSILLLLFPSVYHKTGPNLPHHLKGETVKHAPSLAMQNQR